jgi:hypothetical protein
MYTSKTTITLTRIMIQGRKPRDSSFVADMLTSPLSKKQGAIRGPKAPGATEENFSDVMPSESIF